MGKSEPSMKQRASGMAENHAIYSVCAAIYRWCGRMVAANLARREYEQAASWAWLAGFHASQVGNFGILADPQIEDHLLAIGRSLACPPRVGRRHERNRFLHVLSEGCDIGGHTRLCKRWIDQDTGSNEHSVILTAQCSPFPRDFRKVVLERGGAFVVLDPKNSLVDRAQQLRNHAAANADVIVLHTHMMDPIPIMAFAVNELPPVVLLNHAESLFWFGGSVTDLVADLNQSSMKRTKYCRGISEQVLLPLPLDHSSATVTCTSVDVKVRHQERQRLGIPNDSVVYLTIGSAYKYEPVEGYAFIPAALKILDAVPGAHIIAVGPSNEGPWASAYSRSGGRLRALGTTPFIHPLHAASDVYLEGIPCGSLTAILEAGLAGLPCVRNTLQSTSVGRSDDPSFVNVPSPRDVDEYVHAAVNLGMSLERRRQVSGKLQEAIVREHCGEGWRLRLRSLYDSIPRTHKVRTRDVRPSDDAERDFLIGLRRASLGDEGYATLVGRLYEAARNAGICLHGGFDDEMRRDLDLLSASPSGGRRELFLWRHEYLGADARFAFEQQDWPRLRTDFYSRLNGCGLTMSDWGLGAKVILSLFGARTVRVASKSKRFVTARWFEKT